MMTDRNKYTMQKGDMLEKMGRDSGFSRLLLVPQRHDPDEPTSGRIIRGNFPTPRWDVRSR